MKEEIIVEVKIFNPKTITVAIGLAKLAEEKFNAQCKQVRKPFMKLKNALFSLEPNCLLQVKCLSPKEMKKHREKGLYYNYDKKI